jgi:hypothetical protein
MKISAVEIFHPILNLVLSYENGLSKQNALGKDKDSFSAWIKEVQCK